MASFRIGVVDGVVMNSFDTMYVRAQNSGDKKLVRILEHRAEVHACGPCDCEKLPEIRKESK